MITHTSDSDTKKKPELKLSNENITSSANVSTASSKSDAIIGALLILIGCCLNVYTLECITKRDPTSGSLITFSQFAFTSLQALVSLYASNYQFSKRQIPLRVYLTITVLYFTSSILNNKSLGFSIGIPLHTVFRSASLVGSLFVGGLFYKIQYSRQQVISCLIVTLGIILVTSADAINTYSSDVNIKEHTDVSLQLNETSPEPCCSGSNPLSFIGIDLPISYFVPKTLFVFTSTYATWCIGVLMISGALLMSSFLGHAQDRAYKTYGKDCWREALFYIHTLSLPAFIFVKDDILEHARLWLDPDYHFSFSFAPTYQISLYVVLLVNLLLQIACIRGVYILTANTSSLTTNVVMTLRKLLSLLLSVYYFNNPFSTTHWLGTVLVFAGVVYYTSAGAKAPPKAKQL